MSRSELAIKKSTLVTGVSPLAAVSGLLFAVALAYRIFSGAGLFFTPALEGHRTFEIFDSTYQLRRVEKTLADYPRVPFVDNFHYYPKAPDVPWPPGYTLFLATVVKFTGLSGNVLGRETLLGFIPPLVDSLSVVLFFLLFCRWTSLPVAGLAGGLLALSYQNITYSELGYLDHHYFVTFLTAVLAWLYHVFQQKRSRTAALMLGAWAGGTVFFNVSAVQYSLLALIAVGATSLVKRREESPWALTPYVLGAACVVSLASGLSTPAGRAGLATYDQTSMFQFLLIVALSGAWLIGSALLTLSGKKRLAVVAGSSAVLLALAGSLWPNILEGAKFLLAGNRLNGVQGEEVSILVYGHRWYQAFTLFALFLPWGVLKLWGWRQQHPDRAVFVGLFLAHGLLSGATHFLYVQYLFPWYALAVALGVAGAIPKLPDAWRYAALVPFAAQTLFSSSSQVFDKKSTGEDKDREAIVQTVQAFDWLGRHSPQVSETDPEYSVLAHRDHGHLIVERAHRPVIVSPFSTTAFVDHMKDYVRACFTHEEDVLLSIMDRYKSRYLVLDFRDNTMVPFLLGVLKGEPDVDAVAAQAEKKLFSVRNNLLFFDGELRWRGTPSIERLRLIYEVPKTVNTPLQTPQGQVQHSFNALKFFEKVEGARLVGAGWPPRVRVVARLPLRTNTGRRFVYSAFGVTDDSGRVEMTVPYPTEPLGDSGVSPLASSYAVGVSSSSFANVPVTALSVERGRVVEFVAPGKMLGRGR